MYTKLFPIWLLLAFMMLRPAAAQQQENFFQQIKPSFTENKGQVSDQNGQPRPDVLYLYNTPGFKFIFLKNSFSYEFSYSEKPRQVSEANGRENPARPGPSMPQQSPVTHIQRVDIQLPGANPHPSVIAEEEEAIRCNYYLAHTPAAGIRGVHSFRKLIYRNIYPNIDFVFHALPDGHLKYDIVVHPGGRLQDVRMLYQGMTAMKLENNEIQVTTALGKCTESIPQSYLAGTQQNISVRYASTGRGIGFTAEYDKRETLVIDPSLMWATYFGGTGEDMINKLALDNSGNVYLCGTTGSSSYIATAGAYQSSIAGSKDALLACFTGKGLPKWATYYGGQDEDNGIGISTDNHGSVYMAGNTKSTSGIATPGAYQDSCPKLNNYCCFLTKFDTSGRRVWATYYGGDYYTATQTAVDPVGNIVFAGTAAGNIFLSRFDSSGHFIKGVKYHGNKTAETTTGMALDPDGNIFICGNTQSPKNFATYNADDTIIGVDGRDAFLCKCDSSYKLLWCTYIGGNDPDYASDVIADKYGNACVVGTTWSLVGIATSNGFCGTIHRRKNSDAFLIRFSSKGQRLWGTYYGGDSDDGGSSLAMDSFQNIYLVGNTFSTDSISINNFSLVSKDLGQDGFYAVFKSEDGHLNYGAYFGGSGDDWLQTAVADAHLNIYFGGYSQSLTSLSTSGSYQSKYQGGDDGFFFRLAPIDLVAVTLLYDKNVKHLCQGKDSTWIKLVVKNAGPMNVKRLSVKAQSVGKGGQNTIYGTIDSLYSGQTDTFLFSQYLPITQSDTITIRGIANIAEDRPNDNTISIINAIPSYIPPKLGFSFSQPCTSLTLGFTDTSSSTDSIVGYDWDFGDSAKSTQHNPTHSYASNGSYIVSLTIHTSHGCSYTLQKTVLVHPAVKAALKLSRKLACLGDTVSFTNTGGFDSAQSLRVSVNYGDRPLFVNMFSARTTVHRYYSPGIYHVALAVNYIPNGCADTMYDSIQIIDGRNIIPAINAKYTCEGNTIILQDTSATDTGLNAVYRRWDFGDNTSDTGKIVKHVYKQAGTYYVTLWVRNAAGCQVKTSRNIAVYAAMTASINIKPTSCSSEDIIFNANIQSGISAGYTYLWDFGDGDTSTLAAPTHHYSLAGGYHVKLSVHSNMGCDDTAYNEVTVYPKPDADFYVSNGCAYDQIQFSDRSSIDAPSRITAWKWNFGNGNNAVSFEQNPRYAYLKPGLYEVYLEVTSSNGCKDTFHKTVEIYSHPTADFDYSMSGPQVQFHAKDSGFSSYLWDFGDGSTSTQANPLHTYDSMRLYAVKLRVASPACGAEKTQVIALSGIAHPTQAALWHIYPNPVHDGKLVLEAPRGSESQYWLKITDITGKTWLEQKDIKTSKTEVQLPAGMKPGVYFMQIGNHDGIQTQRIEIQ